MYLTVSTISEMNQSMFLQGGSGDESFAAFRAFVRTFARVRHFMRLQSAGVSEGLLAISTLPFFYSYNVFYCILCPN